MLRAWNLAQVGNICIYADLLTLLSGPAQNQHSQALTFDRETSRHLTLTNAILFVDQTLRKDIEFILAPT